MDASRRRHVKTILTNDTGFCDTGSRMGTYRLAASWSTVLKIVALSATRVKSVRDELPVLMTFRSAVARVSCRQASVTERRVTDETRSGARRV